MSNALTLSFLGLYGLFSRRLFFIFLCGAAAVFSAFFFSGIVIGDTIKVVEDLGLRFIAIIGSLGVIAIGAGQMKNELEEKTLFTVLCKPVSRIEFMIGKAGGLLLISAVQAVLLSFCLWLVLIAIGSGDHIIPYCQAVLFIIVQLFMVSALITLFSAFSTPYLSGLLVFSIYIIGHFLKDLLEYGKKYEGGLTENILIFMYYLLPNFDCYQITNRVIAGQAVGWGETGLLVAYGIGYGALLILAAGLIFEKRDL